METRVDVDQKRERVAEGGERVDRVGMIHRRHESLRVPRQNRQTLRRRPAHHGRGDQDVVDTAVAQRLGLAQLGAAHADRARRDLPPRDLHALVGLGVGTQRHASHACELGHGGDIALEGVEFDQQRGGVQRRAGALLTDQMTVKVLRGDHAMTSSCGAAGASCREKPNTSRR